MNVSPRFLDVNAPVLARIGNMETRLARTKDEVRRALQLRHAVFHSERHSKQISGVIPDRTKAQTALDVDLFDAFCDHLLVLDGEEIVGTYRLLLQERALDVQDAPGFYSAAEFNLDRLLACHKGERLLELGRSCIAKPYRTKRTMELLWAGTWAYAVNNKIDVLFGCASFEGTDLKKHAASLAFLGQQAAMPATEDCAAKLDRAICLQHDLPESLQSVDTKRALVGIPPLLKGYLRLGAKVASQAFVDESFGSIDVLVVLKVKDINPRYLAHYGSDASRFAA